MLLRYATCALFLFLAASTLILAATCEPPAIEVQAYQPSVFQVGSTARIRIAKGTFLDEVEQLAFSHPGIQAKLLLDPPPPFSSDPEKRFGQFELSIAPDVPLGYHEVRAIGRFGISNPLRLLFLESPVLGTSPDPIATQAIDALPNHHACTHYFTPAQITSIRIPIADQEKIDLWCFAPSLDLPSIPFVILYAPDGRELLRARTPAGQPLHLQFDPPIPGDYRLALRDFLYRGGEEFQFVLARGTSRERESWSTLRHLWRPSRAERFLQQSQPWLTHPESPDSPQPDSLLLPALPAWVQGEFHDHRDLDAFEFLAKAGESYAIESASRSLQEPTDLRMIVERIQRSEGKPDQFERIQVVDDQPLFGGNLTDWPIQDPWTTIKADKDAPYRITLQNLLHHRDGPPRQYRLRIDATHPHWDAIAFAQCPNNNPSLAHPMGLLLGPGDVASIRVAIARREGFAEPVLVEATGLPPGVSCPPAIIHPSQSETELHVHLPNAAPAWFGPILIATKCTTQPEAPVVHAIPCAISLTASPERGLPQFRQTQQLMLAIGPDPTPFTIQLGSQDSLESAPGAKIEIPIRVTRREGGTEKLILRPANLPTKATMPEVTIEAKPTPSTPGEPNISEAKAELQIAADTPRGEYTFWLVAEGKVRIPYNPQSLQRAEVNLAHLQTLKAQPPEGTDLVSLDAAITKLNSRIEQLKKETTPREYNLFEPSLPIRIRIP